MKAKPTIRRYLALAMSLFMIFTMMPMAAHATETEHTHEWHSSWSTDADGHWHICVAGDGCTEKGSYAAHDWNTNYTIKSCNTCYYYESHTHTGGTATCNDRATCELCGFLYGDTDSSNHKGGSYTPNDAATHKVSCQCGVMITESEAHSFLDWYDNGDGRETRYCMWCGYTEYRTIEMHTHKWGEWTFNGDGTHTRVCTTDSSHTENGNCDELEWSYDSDCHSGRWLCDVCNGGVDRESMNYPEHVYSHDTDLTCDTCGYTRSVEGSLSITGSMPDATVGEAYSASFSYTGTVSGMVFWNATGLPDGLTINYGTGTISGTPTTAGTYEVTVSMGVTGGGSAAKDFTLTVNEPEHTHSYTSVETDPTCTEQGYTTYTCECGDSYVDDHTETLDHEWHKWEQFHWSKSHRRYCQNCGYYEEGPCSFEILEKKDAAHSLKCVDCGYTFEEEHKYWANDPRRHTFSCEMCGYEMKKHVYSDVKLSEQNPENYHILYCAICGEKGELKAEAHAFETKRVSENHWKECSVCKYATEKEEHVYSDDSDTSCNECGYVRHIHSYSTATCTAPATCSCGAATGGKDPSNHTGGTEIRNAVEATRTEKGYTGDIYCKGCGSIIESGEEIPRKGYVTVKIDDDAEVIVEDHAATLAPIAGSIGEDADIEYVSLDDKDIEIIEPISFTYDGVTYHVCEIVEIDGTEYIVDSFTMEVAYLLRLTDGVCFEFNLYSGVMQQNGAKTYKKISRNLIINGVTYDVIGAINPSDISEDKLDIDRLTYWVLYYEGKPVGQYFPNQGYATFNENYDPATLKAQRDDIYLGRVTAGNTAIADLTPGKTYNAYVVGANEIHLEGAENVCGTVTQIFEASAQFVGKENVKFIAVHVLTPYAKALAEAAKTRLLSIQNEMEYRKISALYNDWERLNKSLEYGTVTVDSDGKTLTATYEVDSFSPFIVYSFVEADEPEIKTLSVTIVDGSDDTTEAPGTSEPVVAPPTNDGTIWYIIIAVVVGAIAVVSAVYGKRRKSKAN